LFNLSLDPKDRIELFRKRERERIENKHFALTLPLARVDMIYTFHALIFNRFNTGLRKNIFGRKSGLGKNSNDE
jgi:hypothetical protein